MTLTSQPAGEPGGAEGEDRTERSPTREPDGGDRAASSETPTGAPRPARPSRGSRPAAAPRASPPGGGGGAARRAPAAGPAPQPGRPTGRRPDAAAKEGDRPTARKEQAAAADGALSDGEPAQESGDAGERQAKAPWHFKFIVVGSVVYLGWRLYQGISWLAHHI